jgi:NADH dehydrogenase [ubiquinone] 1 alpha subcomplex assembly factor 7
VTPLERLIRRRVAIGPVTVAEYMKLVLAHPKHGYYPTRDPIGLAGDFITAPEISQMFGELIGLWCAHVWGLIGAPKRIALIELGPGRGTLMADALRAVRKVAPGFAEAAEIHLVDTSPPLRDIQREKLADAPVFWQKSLSAAPREQAIIIGNEFLDALPVHQLVRTAAGWCERQIGIERDGRLGFTVASELSPLADLLDPVVARAPKGSIAEISPKVRTLGRAIGKRVARYGGAALLIDYGHAVPGPGDTLQAVRRHRKHLVLNDPGEADVTAHVDFAAFGAEAALEGGRVHGPVEQGLFLRRLGIVERAERLGRDADQKTKAEIDIGLRRLIEPRKMGSLFKALAIGPAAIDHLPGFVP